MIHFYIAERHDGRTEVQVEIDGNIRHRIEVGDRDEAVVLINAMVHEGVERFGGVQTYSHEQRN
jgi:hypothetical protein